MSKKDIKTTEEKQNIFAIFLLFFPTIIVAAIPEMNPVWLSMVLKLLVAMYQLVVVKNFVDKYYGN